MQIKQELRNKYKGKALIIPNYTANKKFYSIEDFSDTEEAIAYLAEINDHEADFTEDGILLFKDMFGLENLADILFKKRWYEDEYKSANEIHDWLKWWEINARKIN